LRGPESTKRLGAPFFLFGRLLDGLGAESVGKFGE
jgi:hypothetical protein